MYVPPPPDRLLNPCESRSPTAGKYVKAGEKLSLSGVHVTWEVLTSPGRHFLFLKCGSARHGQLIFFK